GAGAGSFGSSVLALIAFDDPLGPNPFASLVDGNFYTASITLSKVLATANASPVPVPGTLPLLLTALLGLGWVGRRHKGRP
ncbi:PEP-CTERM sorting domain-containing protein, partial [Accumulibacter sp.]|uniref:PEP-CTERM sorting domain-containing protein n=1 Tax=Accumulibacter sp. TaxID=2053492 RepID=UPI002608D401